MSKKRRGPKPLRPSIRHTLRKAQRRRDLVTLPRRYDAGFGPIQGFVVGLSRSWVLLARVSDGLEPDGWTALRLKDIRKVRATPAARTLTGKALKARGHWPPEAPRRVDLSSVSALLASVDARQPLFSVYVDKYRPYVFWLGVIRRHTRKLMQVQAIGPRGTWRGSKAFWLRDITRVDFGDKYAEAVHLVGGDAPVRRRAGRPVKVKPRP